MNDPGRTGSGETPAAIQGYGFLIGVDRASEVIAVVSANLAEFVGAEPTAALGASVRDVLGVTVADQLPVEDAHGEPGPHYRTIRLPPVAGEVRSETPPADLRTRWEVFEVAAYPSGRLWVWEFEPVAPSPVALRPLYDTVLQALDHSRHVDTVNARCMAAAEQIRALTGYDRVLVYRLDTAAHGAVLADAHRADLPDIRGRAFPSGAIAPRRRELYEHLVMRMVTDATKEPVDLVVAVDPLDDTAERVDLSTSLLRAPSFQEQQYLLRLGVSALLTVPLVIDGRLWGLLACHHSSARRIPHDVRAACDLLGRLLSWEVRSAQLRVENDRLSRLGGLVVEVVTAMTTAGSLTDAALAVHPALLGMTDADGVVLQIGDRRVTAGTVPDGVDLDRLVPLLSILSRDVVPPWSTDAMPAVLDASGFEEVPGGQLATGVLYAPFAGRDSGYAVWVRGPDLPETEASADTAADGGVHEHQRPPDPSPAWPLAEYRRARPWLAAERTAAATFANAIPALLLQQAHLLMVEQEVTAAAERRDLEHQLHQHQRLESLGQLAGGVAHDFNNLLAVIVNYLDFVGNEVDAELTATGAPRWAAVHADLTHINAATHRAADLTHQLLAFARRETIRPRAVNLNAVIDNLDHLLRRTIGVHITFTCDLDADLDLILADPGQVEQILVNLAVNARDAIPDGGQLTIATRRVNHGEPHSPAQSPARATTMSGPVAAAAAGAEQAGRPGARGVQLQIRDTGSGIPQEVIDRVFEPFFTTKEPGSGTGLGLATVHGIVQQAGGTITITSVTGSGTTFTVVFPATTELIANPNLPPGGVETDKASACCSSTTGRSCGLSRAESSSAPATPCSPPPTAPTPSPS